jgi:hypothetical protein
MPKEILIAVTIHGCPLQILDSFMDDLTAAKLGQLFAQSKSKMAKVEAIQHYFESPL